jgi:cytoskeletal protein RodZ
MSFNANDNNLDPISRNNYEEYFLLYADNELNEQDRKSVEAFVLAHPDLQAELELFLSAKLPMEDINLEHKESLLADSMKLNAVDESLLLYLDNELDKLQRKSIEKKLLSDENFALQYKALLKTKLKPEQIVYPYKKELYHHEEKRRFVFSAYWMRIAVAVIILLGMGIFWFSYQPNPSGSVARAPTSTKDKNNPASEASNDDVVTEPRKQSVEPTIKIGETDDATNITRHIEKKSTGKEKKMEPKEQKSSVMVDQNTIAKTTKEKKPEKEIAAPKDIVTPDNTPAIVQQQTVNNKIVTSPAIASLNNQTTEDVTAVHASIVEPDDEKNSKLKGFLRKATRFIERRTNISTTNENNQLLIGAVAIQL